MTRGLYGIRKDGVDKCIYSNSDSYPECLGQYILEVCAEKDIDEIIDFFDKELLSREEVDIDFIKNSLFCEYAYIVNIDDEILEFYKGFQHKPQENNRYGQKADEDGYYPCKLLMTISFDDIKTEDIDKIVFQMKTGLDLDDIDTYLKLITTYNLSKEDAISIIKDGKGDKVCGIYKDTYDVGHEYLNNIYGIPNFLINYINYEKFGEDTVEDADAWYQLPSGKYAHLS